MSTRYKPLYLHEDRNLLQQVTDPTKKIKKRVQTIK